jgi:hypothetical protein
VPSGKGVITSAVPGGSGTSGTSGAASGAIGLGASDGKRCSSVRDSCGIHTSLALV